MVSAFRGLNEIVQARQGTGLVMDWKQSAGTLLLGGDSRVIKVWDAQTETQGLVCNSTPWVNTTHCCLGFTHKFGEPCHRHFIRFRIVANFRGELR